jgi:hypothetical protein
MKRWFFLLFVLALPLLTIAQSVKKVVTDDGQHYYAFIEQIEASPLNETQRTSVLYASYYPQTSTPFLIQIGLLTNKKLPSSIKKKQQKIFFKLDNGNKFQSIGEFDSFNNSLESANSYYSIIQFYMTSNKFKRLIDRRRIDYRINSSQFRITLPQADYFDDLWESSLDPSTNEWKTVEKFSGSGIKNTPAFTIDKSEWRIKYQSEGNSYAKETGAGHILQLFLLKPGEELSESEIIVNQVNKPKISGDTYLYKTGRFYIKSNSANGDWEILVQVRSNN